MDRVIEVLGERVIDDADQRAEIVGKGEGDADVRMGVHEVCGFLCVCGRFWVFRMLGARGVSLPEVEVSSPRKLGG